MTNPKHTDTSGSGDHNGPEQTFRDTERNLRDRIEALEAENERLREALRNIRALATKRQNACGPDGCLTDIKCFARAALEIKP